MNDTRIAALRRDRGWTQERLAETSAVGLRTIQRLESGSDASLETLSRIADALDVQVSELFADAPAGDLGARVESYEVRAEEQQARRDAQIGAWRWLYIGIGVIVTLIALLSPWRAIAALLPAIVLVYWVGGFFLLRALMTMVIEPRLDERYPLSKSRARLRAQRRAGRR